MQEGCQGSAWAGAQELQLWKAHVKSVIEEPRTSREEFARTLRLSGVAVLDSSGRLCSALDSSESRLKSRLNKVPADLDTGCAIQ